MCVTVYRDLSLSWFSRELGWPRVFYSLEHFLVKVRSVRRDEIRELLAKAPREKERGGREFFFVVVVVCVCLSFSGF